VTCMREHARAAGKPDPFETMPEAAVAPDRFRPEAHRWGGGWISPPAPFPASCPQALISAQLESLAPALRAVVVLRDCEGWPTAEIAAALAIEESQARLLLHRGRSQLRAALERHFATKGRGS